MRTIVIASQHNNRLQTCLHSLKTPYEVYVMWDGGDKSIDLTQLPAMHLANMRVIYWEEIRQWVLETFDIPAPVIDVQTTLKKCFYYLYLFNHGITTFFYTDDDVYFWEDPIYDGTLVYQVDPFLGQSVSKRVFYNKQMPKYCSYYAGIDKYTFPLVGNFYIDLKQDHVDMYRRMMNEFLQEFALIQDWKKPSDTANRNTNVFYIDSFFLDAFFFMLMRQPDVVVKRVSDWVILAGCLKMMIAGHIRQHKQPKGRTLVHYNVWRKSIFFDYFFSTEEAVVTLR